MKMRIFQVEMKWKHYHKSWNENEICKLKWNNEEEKKWKNEKWKKWNKDENPTLVKAEMKMKTLQLK